MASIVVVDDDDDMRETLTDLLAIEGHELRSCRNGVEALRALEDRLPQLVLTDIEMPVLDGTAMVFRMFVENLGRENIPVILASGAPDVASIAQAVGTPYFLVKPFTLETLTQMIDRALVEAVPPRPPSLLG
jgi:DNA-binding NtrC family response regulator